MITIWKFPLQITYEQEVLLPANAEILGVQHQGGLMLWALLDSEKRRAKRTIVICGTGNPVPLQDMRFISTVQMGPLVWHIFEKL